MGNDQCRATSPTVGTAAHDDAGDVTRWAPAPSTRCPVNHGAEDVRSFGCGRGVGLIRLELLCPTPPLSDRPARLGGGWWKYGERPVTDQPGTRPDDQSDGSVRGDQPVNDQLDVTVHDNEVLAEIEMMTNLIIATSESDGPLPQVQIDEILGVAEDTPPI